MSLAAGLSKKGVAPMRGIRTVALAVFLASVFVLSASSMVAAEAKGAFAFRYGTSLTQEEIDWLRRFDVVVPGDILPEDQAQQLRDAGADLFFYAWATGDYIDDPTQIDPSSWEAEVWANRFTWLLNPANPDRGPDGLWQTYYYDPFSTDFGSRQAARLNETRVTSGYRGVFFDLSSSLSVPDPLLDEYGARHPGPSYDQSLAAVFDALKHNGSRIFTNQGYRTPATHLPVAHYDLSESLITGTSGEPVRIYVDGRGLEERYETRYSAWSDLKLWVDDIQARVERYNRSVKIFHLGYVNPWYRSTGRTAIVNGVAYPVFREEADRPAIFYGFAASKLWGHDSYSWGDTVRLSQDEVYFAPLGKPVDSAYEQRDGAVVRYYENGVVVVAMTATTTVHLDLFSPLVPREVTGLVDLYEGQNVLGFQVTIEPTVSEASGLRYPGGRVYLYDTSAAPAPAPAPTPTPTPSVSFGDVAPSHPFSAWIGALAAAGTAVGCSDNPPQYCPDADVTRGEMAVFLLRGMHGAGYQPPAATGFFTDVGVTHSVVKWIEELARERVTAGCSASPPRYCPEATVTRGQMAVFLLRAKHGADYQPPQATGTFADVPIGHLFAPWIEQLAREGITGGCGTSPARYCPDSPITRGQMAVFLVRAFNLPM